MDTSVTSFSYSYGDEVEVVSLGPCPGTDRDGCEGHETRDRCVTGSIGYVLPVLARTLCPCPGSTGSVRVVADGDDEDGFGP